MYRGYRATSVPPGLYRSTSQVSVKHNPGRLPSYCAPHGQYYGYTACSTPVTTPAVRATKISTRPSAALTSTKYFDPIYPTRQFGTRLSKGYGSAALSRPEIYEQVYGVSHLPGYGRDSYSAYKMADATIDDSDDLVTSSVKRDNQVLRDVERTMLRANCVKHAPFRSQHEGTYHHTRLPKRLRACSVPPPTTEVSYVPQSYAVRTAGPIVGDIDWSVPRVISNIMPSPTATLLHAKAKAKASVSRQPPCVRPATFVRASSVPPQLYRSPVTVKSSKVSRTSAHHRPRPTPVKVRSSANDVYYKVSPPKVQYHHETVSRGSELLSAKERMFARELVDLTSPSATLALRMRIQGAQNSLQKQGSMIGKYYVGPDRDDIEVDAELRRIKATRALRAKSVV